MTLPFAGFPWECETCSACRMQMLMAILGGNGPGTAANMGIRHPHPSSSRLSTPLEPDLVER